MTPRTSSPPAAPPTCSQDSPSHSAITELALGHLDDALTNLRAVGDTWSRAHVYSRIGDLQADHGDQRAAHKAWSAAAELLNGNTEPNATQLRQQMINSLNDET